MKDICTKINFFVATFVSILGISMIYEVFAENDFSDKIDDALLVVLGFISIWWYKKSGYKGKSSLPAVIITGLALLTKILAIVIEHVDKEAVGDDIGVLIYLLLAFIFIIWQLFIRKKPAE